MRTTPASEAVPTLGLFTTAAGPDSVKRRALAESTVEWFIADRVFPFFPVDKVASLYCGNNGRPTKNIATLIGLVVIQELSDMTNAQAIEALCFNALTQHALHITNVNDEEAYISTRTYCYFRAKLISSGMFGEIFNDVTQALYRGFGYENLTKARIDSTHFKSNIANLTRGQLISKTTEVFLRDLKRELPWVYDTVAPELAGRYTGQKTISGCFGEARPSDRAGLLETMASDVHSLVVQFKDNAGVSSMRSFIILDRLHGEQVQLVPGKDGGPDAAVPRPPKEVPSSSLQSPFDAGAGYCGQKKQKGYKTQLTELYDDGTGEDRRPPIIVNVQVEGADRHDGAALAKSLDALEEAGFEIDEVAADCAYTGDSNLLEAAERGVELVGRVPGPGPRSRRASGKEGGDSPAPSRITLNDFEKDDLGCVTACPEGQKAKTVRNSRFTGYNASFDCGTCKGCPRQSECPVKIGLIGASLNYTDKDMRTAIRKADEKTEAFTLRFRWRAGIEALNSLLKRVFGLGRLRVRGEASVEGKIMMKCLAANIWKLKNYALKLKKSGSLLSVKA